MAMTGRLAPGFCNRIRLRGLYRGRWLVRSRDLQKDEPRVSFAGSVVPDVFDPNDPFSVSEARQFCNLLFASAGAPAGGQLVGSGWRDLETTIRRALEHGEIAVVSESAKSEVRSEVRYQVAAAATRRSKGHAWRVHRGTHQFLIVRRGDLLPGEQPVRGQELRDVVESLLAPDARTAAAAILSSLQNGGEGRQAAAGDFRGRLNAAFQSGVLVLVASTRDGGGGGSAAGKAADAGASASSASGADRTRDASTKTHWIEFRFIDITCDEPVSGVPVEVILANGAKDQRQTDADGVIRYDDTAQGDCTLRFDWKDVPMENAYSLVSIE